MGYSKRQFIEEAFGEIGLAEYTFDISPEQEQAALRRLDSMMAEWNASGIRIAYPLPGSPQDAEIDAQTNVPDAAYEAITMNLALKLAPQYGRQAMPATMRSAVIALGVLRARFLVVPQMQLPDTVPLGAGNRTTRFMTGPFVMQEKTRVDAGPRPRN
jgi:hypothetical protein